MLQVEIIVTAVEIIRKLIEIIEREKERAKSFDSARFKETAVIYNNIVSLSIISIKLIEVLFSAFANATLSVLVAHVTSPRAPVTIHCHEYHDVAHPRHRSTEIMSGQSQTEISPAS